MAKTSEPGFFEQHVEKAVLAASLLILVFALIFWVASSPREIKLGGKDCSPGEVDEALLREAKGLEVALRDRKADPVERPDYLSVLVDRIVRPYEKDSSQETAVSDYIPWQEGHRPLEPTDERGPTRPTVELARLIGALVAARPPIAKINREVIIPPPPEEPAPQTPGAAAAAPQPAEPKEVIAAHVVAVLDHGKILSEWHKTLESTYVRASLTFVTVEAERRHLLPDGSWSQPVPVSMFRIVRLPPLRAFDGNNLPEVQEDIDRLAAVQEEILEPQYPEIFWPNLQVGTWLINKPRTEVSDLLADSEAERLLPASVRPNYLYTIPRRTDGYGPVVAPRSPYEERRRAVEAERQGQPLPRAGDRSTERTGQPLPRMETRTGETRPPVRDETYYRSGSSAGRSRADVATPPPEYFERRMTGVSEYRRTAEARPGARPVVAPRPEQPVRPPAGAPRPEPGRRPEAATEQPILPEPVLVPRLAEQLAHDKGILEVWFHDTALTEGVTYSYRLRLVLLNPLFGKPKDVSKPDDAKTLTMTTPWSGWSEPVMAKRPTEFFFVGQFPQKEEVYVDVFTQRLGQRVSHRFSVRRGEPIGGVVKKQLVGFDGQTRSEEVDFRTGAFLVDLEFDKVLPRIQIQRNMATMTTELLLLDANGRLETRTVYADQNSERLQELQKELKQAPALAAGQP